MAEGGRIWHCSNSLDREEPWAEGTKSADALDPHIAREEPIEGPDPSSRPRFKNHHYCSELTAGKIAVPFPATATFLINVLPLDRGMLGLSPTRSTKDVL